MASEQEANNARRNFGGELMKHGAHAIGVEEGKSHGKKGWVVVAHVAPHSKTDMPSSLSLSTKAGEVDVPVVVAHRKPFSLE